MEVKYRRLTHDHRDSGKCKLPGVFFKRRFRLQKAMQDRGSARITKTIRSWYAS